MRGKGEDLLAIEAGHQDLRCHMNAATENQEKVPSGELFTGTDKQADREGEGKLDHKTRSRVILVFP